MGDMWDSDCGAGRPTVSHPHEPHGATWFNIVCHNDSERRQQHRLSKIHHWCRTCLDRWDPWSIHLFQPISFLGAGSAKKGHLTQGAGSLRQASANICCTPCPWKTCAAPRKQHSSVVGLRTRSEVLDLALGAKSLPMPGPNRS